jgi:hypothetical protein
VKAHAVALMALQIAYGVFQTVLLAAAHVSDDDQRAVEDALRDIYDELARRSPELERTGDDS